MTSRPGAAEGRRPWWRAALVTVPALALVAALIGLVGPLTGDHGGGPGPNGGGAPAPVAARTASPAAAASTGAGPAAPVAPAPAALTAATAAGPPAGGPGAGAVDVRRSASAAAAPAVDPVDPARPPQTWAVIVGINRYPRGDHDLRTAAADARDVDDALDGYGVASDHRLLLLDRQATAPNIRAALGWLAARAGPQDTAVVFFAGHAAHIGGRRGVRPEVALIAADDLAVPESQMAGLLAPLRARSVWLALAACYGAEFDGLLAPGRLLTAAAGRGQLAYENDALPHSYLVEYMVQRAMIEGDAGRSVEDAFQWARAEIARRYPGREPTMIDDRAAPLVLGVAARHPAGAASSAAGRPAEPPAPGPGPSTAPAGTDPGGSPGDNCTHVGDAVRLCGH